MLGPTKIVLCLTVAAGVAGDLPKDTLPAELPAAAPAGFEQVAYTPPADTALQVNLGRRLFFDPILSEDRSVSCASCHRPDAGFADPTALSTGVGGQKTTRNAPTLFNRALGTSFMWDGRAGTLEEQVLQPIENPLEMNLALDDALARLAGDGSYATEFQAAFDGPPDRERLAHALAAFVRRLWIGDSPFDRFRAGDRGALSSPELAGFWLYESRGGCWRCHTGANFTDERFHNTGVGSRDGASMPGRFAITGDAADRGAFKTPTLRGLSHTAPYMHDGSKASLLEVVEFYRDGGQENDDLSGLIEPIQLSDQDVTNLVAFLESLSRTAPAAAATEAAVDDER